MGDVLLGFVAGFLVGMATLAVLYPCRRIRRLASGRMGCAVSPPRKVGTLHPFKPRS